MPALRGSRRRGAGQIEPAPISVTTTTMRTWPVPVVQFNQRYINEEIKRETPSP
jgi:hypothetical protein